MGAVMLCIVIVYSIMRFQDSVGVQTGPDSFFSLPRKKVVCMTTQDASLLLLLKIFMIFSFPQCPY